MSLKQIRVASPGNPDPVDMVMILLRYEIAQVITAGVKLKHVIYLEVVLLVIAVLVGKLGEVELRCLKGKQAADRCDLVCVETVV